MAPERAPLQADDDYQDLLSFAGVLSAGSREVNGSPQSFRGGDGTQMRGLTTSPNRGCDSTNRTLIPPGLFNAAHFGAEFRGSAPSLSFFEEESMAAFFGFGTESDTDNTASALDPAIDAIDGSKPVLDQNPAIAAVVLSATQHTKFARDDPMDASTPSAGCSAGSPPLGSFDRQSGRVSSSRLGLQASSHPPRQTKVALDAATSTGSLHLPSHATTVTPRNVQSTAPPKYVPLMPTRPPVSTQGLVSMPPTYPPPTLQNGTLGTASHPLSQQAQGSSAQVWTFLPPQTATSMAPINPAAQLAQTISLPNPGVSSAPAASSLPPLTAEQQQILSQPHDKIVGDNARRLALTMRTEHMKHHIDAKRAAAGLGPLKLNVYTKRVTNAIKGYAKKQGRDEVEVRDEFNQQRIANGITINTAAAKKVLDTVNGRRGPFNATNSASVGSVAAAAQNSVTAIGSTPALSSSPQALAPVATATQTYIPATATNAARNVFTQPPASSPSSSFTISSIGSAVATGVAGPTNTANGHIIDSEPALSAIIISTEGASYLEDFHASRVGKLKRIFDSGNLVRDGGVTDAGAERPWKRRDNDTE
ncbi:uncharacterized protein RCC_09292 [Ramularia collo-cygni]|uniref:Uncharacterized protein n=1 Tax=Ramularia collo-cygni TaxID=112498 RepID=A0A2D3VP12_9PEZI|nr:uncharacterized protein RCC_09292 [Ramularia collo-cygni]CZT23578.1 uncharacterized protein RCC_09292 [Ramularia collo-cygni]